MRLFMTTDAVGGVWRYSVSLAAELALRGVEVRLGVIGPAPSRDRLIEVEGIARVSLGQIDAPLDWLAGSSGAIASGREAIAAAARAWRADIVQVNQPAYVAGHYHAPVVTVAHSCVETWWRGTHGMPAPSDWAWHREAVGTGLGTAAVSVAPSRAFAAVLRKVYRLDHAPVAVLNGLAPREVDAPKVERVLASGRAWDASKNFQLLETAAAAIPWPVRLAGECAAPDGTSGPVMRNVRCLGELDAREIAREYAAAPIYVAPSLHEPFGLGVLEAAQAGAALVLSDIPTFRELWDGAALFFGRGDAGGLATEVNRLIDGAALHARLSSAARRRAARYTIARTGEGMLGVYAMAARDFARVPA